MKLNNYDAKTGDPCFKGGEVMTSTEGLAYVALFVLAITLLLTNQVALATVAIVPYVLASFKYSFPQKKPSGHNH